MIATTFRYPGGAFDLLDPAPRLIGVLNTTPDSFSDGGRYLDPVRAVDHALELEADGAAVIDVGGVSTQPGRTSADEATELDRVVPVVEALVRQLKVPISVDTFRASVFQRCFDAGARILNDVSGLRDPGMIDVLEETGAAAFLMHMQGRPEDMQLKPHYLNVVADVMSYFRGLLDQAAARGIGRDRLAVDPGLGFGKTADHNIEILRRIRRFKELGCALLVGASRKSFIGKVLDRREPLEREWGTVGCTAHLWSAGVHFIRVHNVRASRDVVMMLNALKDN